MEFADWSSLPADLINRIADCFLATNDLDYYMDLRAVCQSWRCATDDPKNSWDPRFRPRHWVVIDKVKTCLLVNTTTGRFIRKELPLLRDYYTTISTRDGLLILMDIASSTHSQDGVPILMDIKPYTVSVLNPITGYLIPFIAPVPDDEFVESATLLSGSTPTLVMLVCNKLFNDNNPDGSLRGSSRKVYMGDPSSESFVMYEDKNACPLIRLAARGICINGESGSVSPFPLSVAKGVFDLMRRFNVDLAEMSDDEVEGEVIWNSLIGYGNRCFLLESAGEILIIFKVKDGTDIYKVDTDRYIPKYVKDIGNRAIFLGGYCRCISVNADMFPSVGANCIYYIKGEVFYSDIHMYNPLCGREQGISKHISYGSPPYTIIQHLSSSVTGL